MQEEFDALQKMQPRFLCQKIQLEKLLETNGYSELNVIMMAVSQSTKHGWLLKGSIRHKVWISLKLSVQLLNLAQSRVILSLTVTHHWTITGLLDNLM